ncbi:hypothetical protein RSSM_02808 [Rhodopirellula sallentina SM41]|uniref:Uncharacterized protein n=1 Tax=Rhodopirellula sallentina SM41 TaxID=1263870 RepID=M5U2W0_9BACT|nr:hypothetical protein RSSM_02808 [Rhodopirellula sallentina SM41]
MDKAKRFSRHRFLLENVEMASCRETLTNLPNLRKINLRETRLRFPGAFWGRRFTLSRRRLTLGLGGVNTSSGDTPAGLSVPDARAGWRPDSLRF